MQITIKAFGQLADILGNSEITLDAANIDELKAVLCGNYPALQYIKYAIAVNKQMISHNVSLAKNDTVALLPPFSGG